MKKSKFVSDQLKKRLLPEAIQKLKEYSSTINKIYRTVELLQDFFKYEAVDLNLLNDSNNSTQDSYDLEKSSFLEVDIKKEISSSIKSKYTTYYMYKHNKQLLKGEIQFFSKQILKMSELKNLTKLIASYVLFFNEILNTTKVPLLRLYITNKKKKLPPPHQQYMTPKNVNSAVTNGLYIVIFRKEEMIKSVLHEVIHYHRVELRNTPNLDLFVKEQFKLSEKNKNDLRLYEAQTDLLAIYLNLCFKLTISNRKPFIKQFERHFQDEIEFMIQQFCKIGKHFRFSSLEDMYLTSSQNNKKFTDINTYSFSYYIIKVFYIISIQLVDLFKIKENDLLESIKETIKNQEFKKIIDHCLKSKNKSKNKSKKKSKNKSKSKPSKLDDKNLRMSLYG